MEKKKNIHKDHRSRVKEAYLKAGISVMADHNILELLLFYGIPYKDTNEIAHELIERFGDLNGVLDASAMDLAKVDGIGENAALLIKLVRDIAVKHHEDSLHKKVSLASEDRLLNFATMKYVGENKEIVYMLSLDAHGNLKHCIKVADGSPNSAVSDCRSLAELALRFDVTNAVIMHNHPSGFATPSQADIVATKAMAKLFAAIEVNFIDHIIVAGGERFSFSANPKYAPCLG